jgi:hypothetical protein
MDNKNSPFTRGDGIFKKILKSFSGIFHTQTVKIDVRLYGKIAAMQPF